MSSPAAIRDGRLHLEMTASVNGRLLSRGNSGSMYWTWPQLLAHASRDATLSPGDVLGSGTVGTGCILELTPEAAGGWLKPGDLVELTIERLGTLRNRVVTHPYFETQVSEHRPCLNICDSARSRASITSPTRMRPDSRARESTMKRSSTTAGFTRAYSVVYHLRPPTRVTRLEPAGTVPTDFGEQPTLRHHLVKTRLDAALG